VAKYRKKPVVVEAMQFFDDAATLTRLSELMQMDIRVDYSEPERPVLKIQTLEGVLNASVGDYIIKGVNGEFYPCKPDIFEKTYEKVEE
jgi:hypothetical protein